MSTYVGQYKVGSAREVGTVVANAALTASSNGYAVTDHSFVPSGGYTAAAQMCFLLAALCIFGGLLFWPAWILAIVLALAGLTSKKGGGTVIVTFQQQDVTPSVPDHPTIQPQITPDTGDQLRTLTRLLDEGLISQSEFDAKRAELLARM